MPMLRVWWYPDHITLPDLLNRTTPLLNPALTGRHDQCLAQRVSVPGCVGAGLERDSRAERPRRTLRLEKRNDVNSTREVIGWSLPGRLRTASRDDDRLGLRPDSGARQTEQRSEDDLHSRSTLSSALTFPATA